MNNFFRILSFARPYRSQILASAVFNILMVIFSLCSITILIPILKIIFDNTRHIVEAPTYTGIVDLKNYLEGLLNYKITSWTEVHGERRVLFGILVFALLMFLLKNLFRYLGSVFIVFIKNAVERDIRNAIHHRVLHLPLAYFSEKRKGDIISRLSTDILEIQWALLGAIRRLIQDPLMIISTLALMLILSPKLTLFVIVLIPLTGFIITYIGNLLKRPSELAKAELGRLLSLIEENVSGLAIIKSYVAEKNAQESFEASNQRHFSYMNKMMYRRELSSPVSELLGSGVILAIIWFGSLLILDHGELEPEVFITYIALFYQIINPAKSISTAVYDIKRGDASANRILQVIDTINPLEDQPDAQSKSGFEKALLLENVHFKYEDQGVVNGVSMEIPKGKTIALVGQSGSGKSTIAYLLNRFYDIEEGSIKIDGVDIRKIKLRDLRKLIGYISQDAVLFHDTVRNNLLFGNPNASEEELIEAAKVANAYEFIQELPLGFETSIGDSGQKLSGGQRQRLTIARAILKNPPILILDEATSALDSESENLVQEALEKVMANRTSIVIAHRLSTIQNADEIIVLQAGKIVESGRHESLLEHSGVYKKLVDLQSI